MAINNTQTKFFESGEIKFSAIRNSFGDLPGTDVKASDYLRNAGNDVDWSEDSTISPRVPDATENADVSTSTNWQMSHLRDSIAEYNITQSGNDEELEFSPTNVPTWNNNLSRNVPKRMDIEGVVYADETSKYALKFSEGEYNNLTINVPDGGAIYGEGGTAGGNGGGALYVENTATYDDVSVTLGSNGQIYAGGGGGTSGNSGNAGPNLPCFELRYFNVNVNTGGGRSFPGDGTGFAFCEQLARPQGFTVYDVVDRNPGSLRSRCRGKGGARSSETWDSNNQSGYDCSPNWNYTCPGRRHFSISSSGGSGGAGGAGQGFSNQSGPGAGGAGGAGTSQNCPSDRGGGQSVGGDGNPGNPGGAWGESVPGGGSGGFALLKKGTVITAGQSVNTVKGAVSNI